MALYDSAVTSNLNAIHSLNRQHLCREHRYSGLPIQPYISILHVHLNQQYRYLTATVPRLRSEQHVRPARISC